MLRLNKGEKVKGFGFLHQFSNACVCGSWVNLESLGTQPDFNYSCTKHLQEFHPTHNGSPPERAPSVSQQADGQNNTDVLGPVCRLRRLSTGHLADGQRCGEWGKGHVLFFRDEWHLFRSDRNEVLNVKLFSAATNSKTNSVVEFIFMTGKYFFIQIWKDSVHQ